MILITRPRDKAFKLESKLSYHGCKCLVEPISAIKFKNQNFLFEKNQVYLIASPRTVNYIIKKKTNLNIKLLIIGISSFSKLKQSGFKNLIYGAQDSDDMIKFLKKSDFKTINYLTGTIKNKNLSTEIRKMGILLKEIVMYETIFRKALSKKCIALIKLKKIKQVVVYSKANAKHIIYVLNKAMIKKESKSLTFFCLSKKIADLLSNEGYKTEYCVKPVESSLIKKLVDSR